MDKLKNSEKKQISKKKLQKKKNQQEDEDEDKQHPNSSFNPLDYTNMTKENIPVRDPLELILNRVEEKREKGIIEPEKTIVFNGKRGTGKTFTLTWLLYKWWKAFPPYGPFPIGCVFTTTKMNRYWNQFFPDRFVHEGMPSSVLKKIAERQAKMLNWIAEDHTGTRAKTVNPWMVIVLDDTITADGFKTNQFLQEFAAMGRHLKICLLITTQYPKAISTLLRENVDYVQVLFMRNIRAKESIALDYLNIYHHQPGKNLQIAAAVINNLTSKEPGEQHGPQFWVDNVAQSVREEEVIFTIKPEKAPKFQIGTPHFWSPYSSLDYEDNPKAFPYPPGFKHDLFADLEEGSLDFFKGYF